MTLVFSAVVVLIGLEIKSFLSEAKTSLVKLQLILRRDRGPWKSGLETGRKTETDQF